MDLFKNITMLIPSHTRHRHIDRLLFNLKDFNCKKIIIDSSENCYKPSNHINTENVIIHHKPNMCLTDKFIFGTSLVETKYIFPSPDDDLYSTKGLLKIYQYIMRNDDCNSVFGQHIAFYFSDKPTYTLKHSHEFLHSITKKNQQNVKLRVSQSLNPYIQSLWAIHKTSDFASFFNQDIQWLKSPTLYERLFKLYMASLGNTVTLPVFFCAREVNNRIGASTNITKFDRIIPFLELFKSNEKSVMKELDIFISFIAEILSNLNNESLDRCKQLVTATLERHHKNTSYRVNNYNSIFEKFLSDNNPDKYLSTASPPYVISNDFFGKSFFNFKSKFPVYNEEYKGCLLNIHEAILVHNDIYKQYSF